MVMQNSNLGMFERKDIWFNCIISAWLLISELYTTARMKIATQPRIRFTGLVFKWKMTWMKIKRIGGCYLRNCPRRWDNQILINSVFVHDERETKVWNKSVKRTEHFYCMHVWFSMRTILDTLVEKRKIDFVCISFRIKFLECSSLVLG